MIETWWGGADKGNVAKNVIEYVFELIRHNPIHSEGNAIGAWAGSVSHFQLFLDLLDSGEGGVVRGVNAAWVGSEVVFDGSVVRVRFGPHLGPESFRDASHGGGVGAWWLVGVVRVN